MGAAARVAYWKQKPAVLSPLGLPSEYGPMGCSCRAAARAANAVLLAPLLTDHWRDSCADVSAG
jgi:hypothetical protein